MPFAQKYRKIFVEQMTKPFHLESCPLKHVLFALPR